VKRGSTAFTLQLLRFTLHCISAYCVTVIFPCIPIAMCGVQVNL